MMNNQAQQQEYIERRSAERYDVNISGKIEVGGQQLIIRIIDISATGMKVWGYELAPNQKIAIDFKGGPSVKAKVVWAMGEAAGLQFSNSLNDSHPLMILAKSH